ncbi:MAG: hypothetical protein H7062_14025 [Candidatus Saccharimonas sp.]|nr:hypothetical protein [Planctomycetaceae bacterium]
MTVARSSPNLIVGVLTVLGICLPGRSACVAHGAELILRGPIVVTTEFHGEDRPLNLPRTRRLILSQGDRRGTTVQWTAGPFVHSRDNRFVVDSRLQVVASQGRNAAVVVLVAQDETHVTHGDRLANVSAGVVRPGVSGIELQVSFLARDASVLASGVYSTRVVGTITGH